MIPRFLGAMACAVMAAFGGAGEGKAATVDGPAVLYVGQLDWPYPGGRFWGVDANGDGMVTGAELDGISLFFDNRNYGPGQHYWTTRSVGDFLFRDLGFGRGIVSGVAYVTYAYRLCGDWNSLPCLPGELTEKWVNVDIPFSDVPVSYVSSVPLPAGAPLMAAGIGALALIRRRKRRG